MNDSNSYIVGNYNKIKQVFINLFKNALEAIDDKGKIHLELSYDDDFVYIYLKDNGVGIPAHFVDRIFEPFFTTKESGTGLGMIITNKIIQEHNGQLTIRSKEKIGTEITVKLPRVEVEQKII
ncbi:MAG: ATP-binding protein [Lysinibacillus sp.]